MLKKVKTIYTGVTRQKGESYSDYTERRKKEKARFKTRSRGRIIHLSKHTHTETEQELETRILKETQGINIAVQNEKISEDQGSEMISKIIKTPKTYTKDKGTKVGGFKDA